MMTIRESRDLSTLLVDELMGSLQVHKQWLQEKSEKLVKETMQS